MSRTEEAVGALVEALISAANAPAPAIPKPARNMTLPSRFNVFTGAIGGWLNVLDGSGEVSTAALGADDTPDAYEIVQRATIEWVVEAADPAAREAAFDAGLVAIDDVLRADRTLGGAVSDARIEAIERSNLAFDGLATIKAASITATLTFLSDRPF